MRFERLELLNFGCYRGQHVVSLATKPHKPAIVFLGGTGFGKSTLFDAINWALYGEEYEADLRRIRERTIVDRDYPLTTRILHKNSDIAVS